MFYAPGVDWTDVPPKPKYWMHQLSEPWARNKNPEPARLCALPGAKGKVGFIAPMSWHFCGACNRLRLTADGKIRSCLFSNHEMDIKAMLRDGASKKELTEFFALAVKHKPRPPTPDQRKWLRQDRAWHVRHWRLN